MHQIQGTEGEDVVCEVTVDMHPRTVHVTQGLTALTARLANLRLTCDALAEAGIPYFLVPSTEDLSSAVGVREGHRASAIKAFDALLAEQPGYISTVIPRPRSVTQPSPGNRKASWVRHGEADVLLLTWYRTEPTHSIIFGSDTGCQVEFWIEREGLLSAPRTNRVASTIATDRPAIPISGNNFTRMAQHHGHNGHHQTGFMTFSDFVYDRPEDVTYPIDVVYTWVDGSDPAWLARRAAISGTSHHAESDSAARFLNRDELRFSLRSLHANAPWVRNIFIVTDDQKPAWLLDDLPGVRIVSHREIFRDSSALPTYNSHAIESQLHHIDELSEHFLYFNDDMFIGRPVTPQAFFLSNGLSKIFLSQSRVPIGPVNEMDTPVDAACKNNRRLLEEAFGRTITQTFQHAPYALHRSMLQEIEERFTREHAATASSKVRSRTDLSITSSLHHYYALFSGKAVVSSVRYSYTQLAVPDLGLRLERMLNRRDYDTFCLNDAFSSANELKGQAAVLEPFLERYFPTPSPYERL